MCSSRPIAGSNVLVYVKKENNIVSIQIDQGHLDWLWIVTIATASLWSNIHISENIYVHK